jgi:predicted membrane channel-forming protein YqfA (hemolysin III family)
MGELFTPTHLIVLLFLACLVVVPFWQILKKTGLPAALSVLMLVPLVNLILLYVIAFSKNRPQVESL